MEADAVPSSPPYASSAYQPSSGRFYRCPCFGRVDVDCDAISCQDAIEASRWHRYQSDVNDNSSDLLEIRAPRSEGHAKGTATLPHESLKVFRLATKVLPTVLQRESEMRSQLSWLRAVPPARSSGDTPRDDRNYLQLPADEPCLSSLSLPGAADGSWIPSPSSTASIREPAVRSPVGVGSLGALPRATLDREAIDGCVAPVLDFSNINLVCPINASEISNRWLHPYVPIPGQAVKHYPASITSFISRILRSYTAVVTRGRGMPPFLHPYQASGTVESLSPGQQPLLACLSVVRICERPLPGGEDVAANVLRGEMDKLYDGAQQQQRDDCDDLGALSRFQAYLVYCMVYFFQLGRSSDPFLRQAMLNLQEIAGSSSQRGLACTAEQERTRPRWEAWIVAEAKRRTLFLMYLFDSLLSAQDGLPSFVGIELEGLLAPATKLLWQAKSRHEWEAEYNIHLVEWPDGGLRIDELWPLPPGIGENELNRRRKRVDRWLENLDEFGTMLYTVTLCTHGG
ncbi:hypothetical protein BX600DRAFT_437765 [Xylariales sp. PMI_506]|nr:hypothetical protein BX600DRAFT_437765 [Xylariales sp. PMI_506]